MKDYNALQVFLVLMETHSTKRTAQKIGRSQSFVSKTLSQLREELSDPLFVRNADGLSPTTYALNIHPRLKEGFEQIQSALSPESFDPMQIDKITLHIIEFYLVGIGQKIIEAIRKESNAVIELRTWTGYSEPLIEQGNVDLGLHILGDKPQSIYQKKLHCGVGVFEGNREGEYVKYIVSGINEYRNHYQKIDPSINASLLIDNHELLKSLMDTCYSLQYQPSPEDIQGTELVLDVALIMNATKRQSPKNQWLMEIIEPLVLGYIKEWNNKESAV